MNISISRLSLKTTKFVAVTLVTISLVSACVTINIYFPAAAAEKAADKIIDDVWQLSPTGKPTEKTEPPNK